MISLNGAMRRVAKLQATPPPPQPSPQKNRPSIIGLFRQAALKFKPGGWVEANQNLAGWYGYSAEELMYLAAAINRRLPLARPLILLNIQEINYFESIPAALIHFEAGRVVWNFTAPAGTGHGQWFEIQENFRLVNIAVESHCNQAARALPQNKTELEKLVQKMNQILTTRSN